MKVREAWLKAEVNDEGYWVCERCGHWMGHKSEVEYHHKKKRSLSPEDRLKRENCDRLCHRCHIEVNPDFQGSSNKVIQGVENG